MSTMSPPLDQHNWPTCWCNKSRRVNGWERLCKLDLLSPTKAKDPCETCKIHNLSQYLFMKTYKNPSHNCGACVKSHSSSLLISIGLFHLGWIGVPNHAYTAILKCVTMRKLKKVGNDVQGRPTLLTTTKGGQPSSWTIKECCRGSKMSSSKHVCDLRMNWYAL
jgi:hypothetical protein